METYEMIYITICLLLAGVFILLRAMKGGMLGLMLKILASLGFVISGVMAVVYTEVVGLGRLAIGMVAVGMLMGMIGDILLDLKVIYDNDKWYLNGGMLSFGIGHVCYFVGLTLFAIYESSSILVPMVVALGCGIALTVAIMLSSKMMGLEFGEYKWQTAIYTFCLSYMMLYSLLLSLYLWYFWIAFAGFVLFFASDIVLSFQYFGGRIEKKSLIVINHILYYLAQIILVAFVFVL